MATGNQQGAVWRVTCIALMISVMSGCLSVAPARVMNGDPEKTVRLASEQTPPRTFPLLGAPVVSSPKSISREIVQASYQEQPADLPQPKKLPPTEKNPFETIEPSGVLELSVGLSKILRFKDAPKRIQLAEEKSDVVTFTVITKEEISVLGKKPGQTVLNIWLPDPKDAAKDKIYSYLVKVGADAHVREALEKYYAQLEKEINHAFPNSRVSLSVVGNRLLLCGQAHDIFEASQILRIVAPRTAVGGVQQTGKGLGTAVEHGLVQTKITKVPEGVLPEDADKDGDGVNPYFRGGLQVVNMLRMPGEQQVMLRVVVAEVNRTALRNMGINFSIANGNGIVFTNTTGQILTSATTTPGGTLTGGNLFANLNAGKIQLVVDALKARNLARSLAEPNLTALNGQTARFHAGGAFPVPVVTGFTAAGLQGVSFVPFGVELAFTPTITDKDRIRLQVNADVSTRDNSNSATVNGTNVPSLSKRTFETVIDLRSGETMAVAGLIQNNYGADSKRLPFLGDVPVVGRVIGGSDKVSAGQQELVILITPVLTRPLDPHHTRPVPGADMLEPSDFDFYIGGRLENHKGVDYQSPIRTDLPRMHQYQQELRTGSAPAQGPPFGMPTIPNQPITPQR